MSVRNVVKSIQKIMRIDDGVDGDAQRIGQLCWMFFLKIIDDQDQELELLDPNYRSPIPKEFQWRTWAADPEGITGDELIAFINGSLFPELKNLKLSNVPGDRRRVVKSVFEDAYNYMKSGQLLRQLINKISSVDFNNLSERQHFGDIYEQILNNLQSAGTAGEYYTPRAITAFMVDRIDPHPGDVIFDPSCGTGGFLTCSIRYMRERYVKTPEQERKMQNSLRAMEKKQLPHMLCVTNMLLHGIDDPGFVIHDNTLARPYISWEQKDRVDIVLANPPFGGSEEDGIESNFPTQFRTKETADLFLALITRVLKDRGVAAVVLPDGFLFGDGVKQRIKEHLLSECNLHTIVRLPDSVFRPYASVGTNLLFFEKGEPTKDIWFYEHRVPDGQKAYSMTRPIRLQHLQGCIDWWGGKTRKGREETLQAWKVTAEEIKARGYNLDIKNPHTVADDHGDPEVLLESLKAAEAQTASLRDQLKAILVEALSRPVESHSRRGAVAMNAERLLAHYEQIADAPGAIGRLRRFILDLAVRGKLVPQDPKDEPASELLKGIAKEKACLAKVGEINKQNASKPDLSVDQAFVLPESWMWVPATYPAYVVSDSDKKIQTKDVLEVGEFPVVDQGKVFIRGYCNDPDKVIRVKEPLILFGDHTREVKLIDFDFVVGADGVKVLRPVCLFTNYYFWALQWLPLESRGYGRHFKLLKASFLPLPPLAEQRRIVSKVDELMALCDKLEAGLKEMAVTRSKLLDSLLAEALEPA